MLTKLFVAVFLLVAVTGCKPSAPPWKQSTPDELLLLMIASFKSDQIKDVSSLEDHMTSIGKGDWQWLVAQHWFKDRPPAKIVERKVDGDRYEIIQLCQFPDGVEKIAVVFFRENDEWKFHDIFMFDMKGTHFDMFLSYALREPIKTKVELGFKNPGIIWEGVSQALPWIAHILLKK